MFFVEFFSRHFRLLLSGYFSFRVVGTCHHTQYTVQCIIATDIQGDLPPALNTPHSGLNVTAAARGPRQTTSKLQNINVLKTSSLGKNYQSEKKSFFFTFSALHYRFNFLMYFTRALNHPV